MDMFKPKSPKKIIEELSPRELSRILMELAEERKDEILFLYHELSREEQTHKSYFACHTEHSGMHLIRNTVKTMHETMYDRKLQRRPHADD